MTEEKCQRLFTELESQVEDGAVEPAVVLPVCDRNADSGPDSDYAGEVQDDLCARLKNSVGMGNQGAASCQIGLKQAERGRKAAHRQKTPKIGRTPAYGQGENHKKYSAEVSAAIKTC